MAQNSTKKADNRVSAISQEMAGVVGIEPTSMVLETTVLPLYYTPKCSNIITLIKKYFHTNIFLIFQMYF